MPPSVGGEAIPRRMRLAMAHTGVDHQPGNRPVGKRWLSATTTRCWATQSRRFRRGHQEVLPQARDEAPSGPQSGGKGAEEKFKEAKEAYEVLSDAKKRALPTISSATPASIPSAGFRRWCGRARLRRGCRRASAASPTPSATSSARSSAPATRGGGRGGNGVYRGADLRYNLELGLEEAARGTEAKIRIPTLEECADLPRHAARNRGRSRSTCTDLPRPRRSARVAGLLLDPADLSRVPRHRQGHSGPLRRPATAPGASRSTRRCR